VRPGDPADCIFLIARGELEILSPLLDGAAALCAASEPLISGLDLAQLQEAADPDMLWDSSGVPDIRAKPGGDTDILLLSDVLASLSSSAQPAPPPLDGARLVGVKGPGESLGLPQLPPAAAAAAAAAAATPPSTGSASLCSSSSSNTAGAAAPAGEARSWKVYVRARGPALVFVARAADLARLVEVHPEMHAAVQQMVTQQETDMMVAEAMRQLRLYNDTCGGRAAQQQPPQRHDECSDMEVVVSLH
jgi:hypothetical protein